MKKIPAFVWSPAPGAFKEQLFFQVFLHLIEGCLIDYRGMVVSLYYPILRVMSIWNGLLISPRIVGHAYWSSSVLSENRSANVNLIR